jgi:hypothetical protein
LTLVSIFSFLNKTTATDRPTAIPDIEPADVYPEDAVAASAFVYVREKDGPLARPCLDKLRMQRHIARSLYRNGIITAIRKGNARHANLNSVPAGHLPYSTRFPYE